MLTPQMMDEKAVRYNELIISALLRENAAPQKMNVLRGGNEGRTTRESVVRDFRRASALADIDNHIMHAIKDLLHVAEKSNPPMTGVIGRFSPVALYAIRELGSVSKMTHMEIVQELHPELKPPKVETGRILAFPARTP